MKSLSISLLSFALLSFSAVQAAPQRAMTVKATVDGMVCSFCAQGLVTHFKKHPAVADVHVDLTRKLLILDEKKGASISDDEITSFVKKSGFTPKKVERVTETFAKVKAEKPAATPADPQKPAAKPAEKAPGKKEKAA